MIVSLEWLKDYTEVNVSPEEFCERMIMSGSNLETMENVGEDMVKVVVGKIVKIDKHPDADSFVETRIEINLQEILEELIERIQKSSAIEFNEYYKSLNLENCNTQNIEAILAEKKKDVIKKNDYESAIQLTLIELVLLEISGSLKEYE